MSRRPKCKATGRTAKKEKLRYTADKKLVSPEAYHTASMVLQKGILKLEEVIYALDVLKAREQLCLAISKLCSK